MVRSAAHWTGRVIIMALCGLISAFLLASGYESAYNRSLPLVHTLDPLNLSAFDARFDLAASVAEGKESPLYGNFGRPQSLKLPERELRLDIVAPIIDDQSRWLARANTVHLLIPGEPRSGNIGVAMLYCRPTFRTINQQNLPQTGDNLFVDTDKDWRYVYRVTSAKVVADDTPYIMSDEGTVGKLVIGCNDDKQDLNLIVEARLLSVQGAVQ